MPGRTTSGTRPAGTASSRTPSFEFGFKSEPQKHLLPAGRVQNLLQSGGTGGCQLHNAMVYVRGGRSTYDNWAGGLGCTGWDYAGLEPFFAAIEARMGVVTAVQDALTQSVIDAGRRLGLPFNPDYNSGPTEYGCVPFQFTIEDSGAGLRRTTTYDKYIGASPPANLTVATGCFVTRLIAGNGVPAVEILFQDELMTVQAGREVVLSAGAIMSPAILLRSGIGDAFALSKLGIDSVSDLPGGRRELLRRPGLRPAGAGGRHLPAPALRLSGLRDVRLRRRRRAAEPGQPRAADQHVRSSLRGQSAPWRPALRGDRLLGDAPQEPRHGEAGVEAIRRSRR